VGTSDLRLALLKGPKVRVRSTDIVAMVAMMALCGTIIRYPRLLVHPVGGVLAGGVEEGEYSSSRHFHGAVDLVQFTYGTSLVLEASDRLKGSTATISDLGRWSLGAHARRLSDCHQQCQADSGMGR
jgi:hypothetical protein